jgi:hypothetical protein
MKILRWALIAMTAFAIGATLYEASHFPVRWGILMLGLFLSVAGVFITAVWEDDH